MTRATEQASVTVHATPAEAFRAVADLSRIGEWSTECTRVRWKGDGIPRQGAKFRGYNRRGLRRWSTTGRVVHYEPGKVFSWNVSFLGLPMANWSYRFEAEANGCRITERWVDRQLLLTRPGIVGWLVTGTWRRAQRNAQTMAHTLEQLGRAIDAEHMRSPA
jgi:hypothetical protein